ncbi:acyltransferase PGAP2 isoform 11 [Homo sapiens]|uniref:acyltransferase PGAP2 isoform 11 n=1 Tax=Homo sapiens TaxID=9606 RepID=UPI0003AE7FEE|nr:post-GPI attachment to proteins factor 2 isoform 11 [Homo sapiens]|eukprot:NP_001269969.1 post-GPI attachment to proteins factor 2 isoform 11 [Homo sapiens]
MARLGSTGGVSGRVVTQHRDSAPFLGAPRLGLRELGPIRGTAPEWHGRWNAAESHPRKCFHCVHCLIPRAHAPHLHSLAVDQEAHSKSGGSQVLQLETAALHHQLHLLLLGAGCLLSAQHVL